VHRHAAATRVSIDLRSIGKQTHLLVRDDGHGFDNGLDTGIDRANGGQPGGPLRLGVGIPGMSARMQQLGGKLDIRSSSGAPPRMPPCRSDPGFAAQVRA
jgi:signal transduction histidine kinase